jgi:large subunit ribosomal protein L10
MGAKAIEEKKKVVQDIADRLSRAKAVIITDYRGLNVAEVTELRRRLREAGIEYKVLKNTLTRRAAEQVNLQGLDEFLTGPNALAFSYDDPVAPAKILNDFAKTNKALELKGGVVEGRVVGQQEVVDLASLPSRDGLLAMLLSVLQAPIRNFAYAVKQLAEQREAGAGAAASE